MGTKKVERTERHSQNNNDRSDNDIEMMECENHHPAANVRLVSAKQFGLFLFLSLLLPLRAS